MGETLWSAMNIAYYYMSLYTFNTLFVNIVYQAGFISTEQNVMGGCCGTDHRHIEAIALACE